ncbi:hypothetical protein O1611_g7207 [Lasiodiplodia mahajangana]|uniref:Uncharacterized protein n=1 Tax=Lasiodiplodia mahajangana TaxID=1108764 RepID=A0ACC2JGC8_9PEZI|nr:hypothetical protein O1611_g7207 [Lasiodiplodia mahajangana]
MRKHAVLIGINEYYGAARNLDGCAEDVNAFAASLETHFGVTRIHKLVSAKAETARGTTLPTYRNVVETVRRAINEADEGDAFILHYSGHGSRTPSKIWGHSDQRQTLLLVTDPSQHSEKVSTLQDVELAALIWEMTRKKLVITVILDCCYSASLVSRADDNLPSGFGKIRGVDIEERRVLNEPVLFSPERLEQQLECKDGNGSARSAELLRHLLLEHDSALIAACRSDEKAHEHTFEGKCHGLLTGCIIDILNGNAERSRTLTFGRIHNLVVGKFRDLEKYDYQHVEFNGRRQQVVFDAEELPWHEATVTKIRRERVDLDAGIADGIFIGAQLAIYSPNACLSNLLEYDTPLAHCVVCAVQDWGSEATLSPVDATIPPGSKAVHQFEVLRNAIMSPRKAMLSSRKSQPQRQIQPTQDLMTASRGIVEFGRGVWIEATVQDLTDKLVHLSIFHNVLDLGTKNSRTLPAKIIGTMKRLEPRDAEALPWDDVELSRKNVSKKLRAKDPQKILSGDYVVLKITNRMTIHQYVTILYLEPSWTIKRLYPRRHESVVPVEGGKSIYYPIRVTASEDYPNQFESFVILATSHQLADIPDALLPELQKRAPVDTTRIDTVFRGHGIRRPADVPPPVEWAATRLDVLPVSAQDIARPRKFPFLHQFKISRAPAV